MDTSKGHRSREFIAPEVVALCIYGVEAVGFAEDAGVIFIYVHPSVYMIHLKSMQIEEVSEKGTFGNVLPYKSFYAPGTAIVCTNLPTSPSCLSGRQLFRN